MTTNKHLLRKIERRAGRTGKRIRKGGSTGGC